MKKTRILAAVAVVAGLVSSAGAQPNRQTYCDAMGRTQWSATTDNHGKTTYRDAQGRVIGTKK